MLAGGAGLDPAAAGSHGQAFWRPRVVQVCSRNSDVRRPCRDPGSLALETELGVSGEQLVPGHLLCSLSGSPCTWHPWVLGGLRVLLSQEEIPKGPSPSPMPEQLGLLTPEDAVVLPSCGHLTAPRVKAQAFRSSLFSSPRSPPTSLLWPGNWP